ncbi:hypothetical protein Xcel_0595 [Xylanimonas cellulosilytica DSM 15894]|uniref:Uncharacterized protein n=1 Tax=Xylanimonas cellulosilytica (strain DSM 15894 / JCM 12276 / CECT 5975 / KCTC 9989 / LMG 20990 / NBRC 107835 / XIL07) TaxID=446471 RepID=D1BWQ2_XYLCX|nr:hypothetical protein [Xylanimonas cellulosilytica]ACZ29634.1 hypothetical protein Xcel_0595 [Xylanimonas cellulosilytica DSM 15894]
MTAVLTKAAKKSWRVSTWARITDVPATTVRDLIKAGRLDAKRLNDDPEQRSSFLILDDPYEWIDSLDDA